MQSREYTLGMNSTEAPLTVRQGVVIASRALCAFCLFNAFLSLTSFPGLIAGLLHVSRELSKFGVGSGNNDLIGTYVRDIALATLRLAIELFFSLWFYRSGPRVAEFLLDKDPAPSDSPEAI
jgi:hypothetical protein